MTFDSHYFACKYHAAIRINTLDLVQVDDAEGSPVDPNIIVLKKPTEPWRIPAAADMDGNNTVNVNELDSEGRPALPMIQVTHPEFPEYFSRTGHDGPRADMTYPVQVTILARDNLDLINNDDAYSSWREAIMLAFEGEILPGAEFDERESIWTCNVQTQLPIDPAAFFGKDIFSSALVLHFHEVRQINSVLPDPAPIGG